MQQKPGQQNPCPSACSVRDGCECQYELLRSNTLSPFLYKGAFSVSLSAELSLKRIQHCSMSTGHFHTWYTEQSKETFGERRSFKHCTRLTNLLNESEQNSPDDQEYRSNNEESRHNILCSDERLPSWQALLLKGSVFGPIRNTITV